MCSDSKSPLPSSSSSPPPSSSSDPAVEENVVHLDQSMSTSEQPDQQRTSDQTRVLTESVSDVGPKPPESDRENSEEPPKLHLTYSAPSLLMLGERKPSTELLSKSSAEDESSHNSRHSSDRGLGRSITMPTKNNGEEIASTNGKLLRASTERGSAHRYPEENFRTKVASKLSDRKKKKILQRLATVKTDGTVEFDLASSTRMMPELVSSEITGMADYIEDDDMECRKIQPLQIVMLIVGTRGDVQPFIAVGKHLQEYGHRVRLATHANFRDFVMTAGLEFYPLGGDPKVLAEYMVKNKGFLPSNPSEIPIQRKELKAIIYSLLAACVEPDVGSNVPFRAQAIIANPPAYGHVHVAECLKVPIHIFFTMPWTPTSEFPHPLARVKNPSGYRISYQIVDSLIWLGIRGMINDFRKKKLKLRPITYLSGSLGSITNLPTGYIWSPHLVPKPKDWGPRVDIVGFCFLDLSQNYKPDESLARWLQAGSKPIYVGFGSLPVVDPKGMTATIVKALEQTGQRGIISRGWGGLGDLENPPDYIYLLDNCPHDWLFPQCAAVVHHGGAGTTAAGLKAACPTTIVPFFGDQPFWGEQVHAKGVGPPPIEVNHFTLDKLVSSIQYMMQPEVKERAVELAKAMENEDGVKGAVNAFHKHLPRDLPEQAAELPSDSSFFSTLVEKLQHWFCC